MNIDAIAKAYDEDGFVVIKGLFNCEELRELEQQLAGYIRDKVPSLDVGDVFYEQAPSKAIKSLFRMQLHSAFFAKLQSDERLLTIMRAVMPGTIIADDVGFFGKAAHDGSVTVVHQDNGFNYWEPPYCLKASVALDAHTTANGAMICQRGSHKLGVLPHGPSGVAGFSQMLANPVDTNEFPEVPCLMEPGDLTLHHTNTVHRSDANTTSQARRMLSLVYRSELAVQNQEKLAEVDAERARIYRTLQPA